MMGHHEERLAELAGDREQATKLLGYLRDNNINVGVCTNNLPAHDYRPLDYRVELGDRYGVQLDDMLKAYLRGLDEVVHGLTDDVGSD